MGSRANERGECEQAIHRSRIEHKWLQGWPHAMYLDKLMAASIRPSTTPVVSTVANRTDATASRDGAPGGRRAGNGTVAPIS